MIHNWYVVDKSTCICKNCGAISDMESTNTMDELLECSEQTID